MESVLRELVNWLEAYDGSHGHSHVEPAAVKINSQGEIVLSGGLSPLHLTVAQFQQMLSQPPDCQCDLCQQHEQGFCEKVRHGCNST